MTPLRIFIGWDSKEQVAFHVLSASILRHSKLPVSIHPLVQSQLRALGLYWRERGPTESTEFSLTRFLVPYLCGYQGIALFMDCDMLCRSDINDMAMYAPRLQEKAVYVCQHDYTPQSRTKFLGQTQTVYPRKNWSSVMLFNCGLCRALTPEYVNRASGLDLHRFHWLRETTEDRAREGQYENEMTWIGSLALPWNWLVSEYPHNTEAKLVHFTEGGPWHGDEYADVDYADEWRAERDLMLSATKAVVA